jgi:CoA:oxalate CoA-transferase
LIQAGDKKIVTTRCPIRIDGKRLFSAKRAPRVGEHNKEITRDFINK